MTSTSFQGDNYYPLMANFTLTSSRCGTHGEPKDASGNNLNNTDQLYPYVFTYCAMTVNDGDTVRGSFDLAKSLICALEKGGLQFAGVAQTISIDFTDTECWPNGGPSFTTGSISATGSAPASFNSNFEKGVVFTFSGGGSTLTFKLAANITSTSIEFIGNESWSDGNNGVMAGKLNKTTGVLQFEKRDERIMDCGAPCTNSKGWNRHTRLYAVLTMSGGEPTGLESLSYTYTDLQADHPTSPSNGFGQFISSSGSLTTGIKSRYYSVSDNTVANLKDYTKWNETSNTLCMKNTGIDDDGDNSCTAPTGIAKFSANTKFALFDSAGTAGASAHKTPAEWLAAYTTFNFTTADPDVDTAF